MNRCHFGFYLLEFPVKLLSSSSSAEWLSHTWQSTITPDAVFLLQLESGGGFTIQRSFLPFGVLSGTGAPPKFCLQPESGLCVELESMSLFSFRFTATANRSEFAFCVSPFYLDYFSICSFAFNESVPLPKIFSRANSLISYDVVMPLIQVTEVAFLLAHQAHEKKKHLNVLGM